ncbi:MAG: FtsB family cell division protein [Micrococcales bacterium]
MRQPSRRPAPKASNKPAFALRGSAKASAVGVWFESMKVSTMTVTVSAMIGLGVLVLAPQVSIWVSQRQQIADLKAQVEQAKQSLTEMKNERSRWEDPAYIRAQARDRLYYVMPGEVSFLVMDSNGIDQSDTSGTVGAKMAQERNLNHISSTILKDQTNWVNGIVQSVLRAGVETPAEPTPSATPGN